MTAPPPRPAPPRPAARRRAACLLAACLALSALAPRAAAAEPTPADKALAEALFQEGRRLMKAGQVAEACPKLAESYRIVPKLGTLLNLATCHEDEGKTASAWAEFTEAAALAEKTGQPDRVRYAREHVAALEKKLSRLVIDAPGAPEGAEVALDGKPLNRPAWGTPIPVDPGAHRVEARAPGKKAWSNDARVPAGPATVRVAVPALEDAAAPAARAPAAGPAAPAEPGAPADAPEGGGGSGARTGVGVALLGLGALGAGAGVVFGLRTFSLKDESDGHCAGTQCDAEGVALRDDAYTSATLSTIAFGVGAAAIAAGIVVLATAPSGAPAGRSALRVAPIAGTDGGGITILGRF